MPTPTTSDHLGCRACSERQLECDAAKGPGRSAARRALVGGLLWRMERLAKREQAGAYDGVGVARAAVGGGAGPEGLCPLLRAGPQ